MSPRSLDAAAGGGPERLVFFADAVVAIAITLLVLPLVDLATQSRAGSVAGLLSDNRGQLGAFALSFLVIARLWMIHHRTFEQVDRSDPMLVRLTLAWLVTVVFLPFPTELLVRDFGSASVLYVATLLAGSLALASTAAWLDRRPALRSARTDRASVDGPHWTSAALLAICLAVTIWLPAVGMWSLLLLLLADPLDAARRRWRAGPGHRGRVART